MSEYEVWGPVSGWYVTREQRIADLKRELDELQGLREE